jgi:hypothetical protein
MNCPPEIAKILLEIIGIGVIRIRALGWSSNAARCAVEADHIHNLPQVISQYPPDALSYYWNVERAAFIEQSTAADRWQFEPLWEELAHRLPAVGERVVA